MTNHGRHIRIYYFKTILAKIKLLLFNQFGKKNVNYTILLIIQ